MCFTVGKAMKIPDGARATSAKAMLDKPWSHALMKNNMETRDETSASKTWESQDKPSQISLGKAIRIPDGARATSAKAMLDKPSSSGFVHADITAVPTTGASAKTSKGTGFLGVRASRALAKRDLKKMGQYKEMITAVGKEMKVDRAVIAALISRESAAGKFLAKDGTGDEGKAIGLMQV